MNQFTDSNMNSDTTRRSRTTPIAGLTIMLLLALFAATVPAQKRSKAKKPAPPNRSGPVEVVNEVETGYLSGEASVQINPKQPTIIRLGLSQNAVSIIEFPASDGIYYIHEGNPKLVSVFQSPTKQTDRSITIYPGEIFVVGRNGSGPSAAISLQMRSGLVIVLEFVPVDDIRKNAHRCVIRYDREEVISARRTAGLAYELGNDTPPVKAKSTRALSKPVTAVGQPSDPVDTETTTGNAQKKTQASVEITQPSIAAGRKSKGAARTGLELSRFVNKQLSRVLKNPGRNLGAFSDATDGLSLAVSKVIEVDSRQNLVIVAVRNETTLDLRIAGSPVLEVVQIGGDGGMVKTEQIESEYVETTCLSGLIFPRSTAFYAIVYDAHKGGSGEVFRVSVSQTKAYARR